MFDKLIETEPAKAEFRDRRSYFVASSVVVGIIFLTAVIISIYASDFSLGTASFELAELVAPVEMAAPIPEEPRPERRPAAATTSDRVEKTVRIVEQARTDQPTAVPETVSTTVNKYRSMPRELVEIGPIERDASIGTNRGETTGPTGLGTPGPGTETVAKNEPLPDPPPVKKPDPPKPPPIKSMGVVNGMASYLPKPAYPTTAKAVGAKGQVNVQVLIDEHGRVVSASAVSGHPLLRNIAETAARNAKFSPTLLSGVPIKVTGVITYNFQLS